MAHGTYIDLFSHRGRHLSYQRGKRNTNPNTSLIKIEGVDDSKAGSFYLGKKVAFVYRASKEVRGSKIRVMWGKVTRVHGTYSPDSRKSRGAHLTVNVQATLVSSALSSATTSLPVRSVPPSASCFTLLRYKCSKDGFDGITSMIKCRSGVGLQSTWSL
jgi:ribosomal protein L35AE/L33A